MDHKEIGWEVVDWIHLAQDTDQWWVLNDPSGFIQDGEFLE
jgi:hypothetical protein